MNKAIIIKSEWLNKKRITKDDFENLLKEEEKWNLIILLQKKKGKIVVQITEIEIVYCLYRMIKKIIIFRIDSTHWIKKYYSNKHRQFNILKIINLFSKWVISLL